MLRSPVLATLLVAAGWPEIAVADDRPPQGIILVMCDDLGWGDVGFNGSQEVRTPHLDAMAEWSLLFRRFYAAAPVCSPTRGSVLTGRHPERYGITFANVGHLPTQELTLAEVLFEQGFRTAHFGKWHLGNVEAPAPGKNPVQHYSPPNVHGFEEFFSTTRKVATWDPLRAPLEFGPDESRRYGWRPVPWDQPAESYGATYWSPAGLDSSELKGDDSRLLMDRALQFLAKAVQAQQRFFVVLWFHSPHLPVVTGERFRQLYPDHSFQEQLYFGCISALDEQVGRLRKQLREWQIERDTLLCFCSDNGPEFETPGSAGPFRGRKRSLHEGGVRVPSLLEWPARVPEGRVTEVPACTSDYYPTILDLLGLAPEKQILPLDGMSLRAVIDGTSNTRDRPIAFHSRKMSSFMTQQYKLVVHQDRRGPELYDLQVDPAEKVNLQPQQPDLTATLLTQLLDWQASCARSAEGADYPPPPAEEPPEEESP